MNIASRGATMAVDWEQRIDYDRLRTARLQRTKAALEASELVGMVFAFETYCPASDRRSAARIEEEVVVTPTGPHILTRFPAEDLLVAGKVYVRGVDLLNGKIVADDEGGGFNAAALVTAGATREL